MQHLLPLSVTNIKKHRTQMVNVKGRGKVRGMIRDTVKDAICHCSASHYTSSNLQPQRRILQGEVEILFSTAYYRPHNLSHHKGTMQNSISLLTSAFPKKHGGIRFFSLSIFSWCNRRYLVREHNVLVSLGRFKCCLFLFLRYRKSSCITSNPEQHSSSLT